MLQKLVLLLVLIGPLALHMFAEGQEFGGYVSVTVVCVVLGCGEHLQLLPVFIYTSLYISSSEI